MIIKGRDLQNSLNETLALPDDKSLKMRFNFNTLTIAENVYLQIYKKDVDVLHIVEELSSGGENSVKAVLALSYAAFCAANQDITFKDFLKDVYEESYHFILADCINKGLSGMFYQKNYGTGETVDSFQWEEYYKTALAVGLTDSDFWQSTPKKIYILARDKGEEEEAELLTRNYM